MSFLEYLIGAKPDENTLETVIFCLNLIVADKRNRAAPKKRGSGVQTALRKEGVSRLFKSF